MSDIELVVNRTKALESLLERGLRATGKGLHEKVSSVEMKLPDALVRKLRFVATLRNKIVHDADYQKLDNRPAFERACDESESELRAMTAPPKVINKGCFGAVVVALGIGAIAVWRYC